MDSMSSMTSAVPAPFVVENARGQQEVWDDVAFMQLGVAIATQTAESLDTHEGRSADTDWAAIATALQAGGAKVTPGGCRQIGEAALFAEELDPTDRALWLAGHLTVRAAPTDRPLPASWPVSGRPLARQGRSSDLGVCRSESFAVNGFLRWSSWYSPANDGTFRQRDAEPRPVVAEEDSLAADPAAEAVSQRLFPSVRTAPGI
jgi:hypothetical protein